MTRGSQEPSLQRGRIQSCRTRGALEPSQRVWNHGTRGGARALLIREAGSEPLDTWQRQSPSYQGSGIMSHWTRGSFGVHFGWEAGSGTAGHVVARGCTPRSLS
jgi:hypothetical protein